MTPSQKTVTKRINQLHRVLDIRHLTESTFLLRLERKNMQFRAGQYLTLGLKDAEQHREYSIYSGEQENYLEILVREIIEGDVSQQLKAIRTGQFLEVRGPYGFLKLDKKKVATHKFVFIASGTGIAPFHSFVSSNPGLDYTLIHGVRYRDESYDRLAYDPNRYVLCTSREKYENYQGYVTTYLDQLELDPETICYVCGNSSMIYEVYNILANKGLPRENILSEVYF
jgi:ferredoxin/flavodoxin---NADP+ reductase